MLACRSEESLACAKWNLLTRSMLASRSDDSLACARWNDSNSMLIMRFISWAACSWSSRFWTCVSRVWIVTCQVTYNIINIIKTRCCSKMKKDNMNILQWSSCPYYTIISESSRTYSVSARLLLKFCNSCYLSIYLHLKLLYISINCLLLTDRHTKR